MLAAVHVNLLPCAPRASHCALQLILHLKCCGVVMSAVLPLQPSEPHLTAYLKNIKHFSDDAVNNAIYPVWTYGYLVLMALASAFLVGVHALPGLRARSGSTLRGIILVGALGRVATRFLLIFGTSLGAMQLMQFTYACGSVAETLFGAYVLQVAPKQEDYMRYTALTQV